MGSEVGLMQLSDNGIEVLAIWSLFLLLPKNISKRLLGVEPEDLPKIQVS